MFLPDEKVLFFAAAMSQSTSLVTLYERLKDGTTCDLGIKLPCIRKTHYALSECPVALKEPETQKLGSCA
jgi:hypothetical protein